MSTSTRTLTLGTAGVLLAATFIPMAVVASVADHNTPVAVVADVGLANEYEIMADYSSFALGAKLPFLFGFGSDQTESGNWYNYDVTDPAYQFIATGPDFGSATGVEHVMTTLFTQETIQTLLAGTGQGVLASADWWDDRFVISPFGLVDLIGYDISSEHFAIVTLLLGDIQLW